MHDLVTIGEALLRLAVPSPARFETARVLDVQIGGAEANVAAACARLGLRTAWISALPENPWGDRVRRELIGHGVDCGYVKRLPQTRLGLYFLEYGVAPRAVHVLYDRRDSAFSRLTAEALDWEPIRQRPCAPRSEGNDRDDARRRRISSARRWHCVAPYGTADSAGDRSDWCGRCVCCGISVGELKWAGATRSRQHRSYSCRVKMFDVGGCGSDQPEGRRRRAFGRPRHSPMNVPSFSVSVANRRGIQW